MRPRGGLIGAGVSPESAGFNSAASGVWTLREAESLRRSGTWPNAVPQPPAVSGLQAWYDAADGSSMYDATTGGSLVAADGPIARWQDKSGNGHHVTKPSGANSPVRKAFAQNGLGAVQYQSSGGTLTVNAGNYLQYTRMINSSLSLAPPLTVFFCGNPTYSEGFQHNNTLLASLNTTYTQGMYAWGINSSEASKPTIFVYNTHRAFLERSPMLLSAVVSPSGSTTYRNGLAATAGSNAGVGFDGLSLGALRGNPAPLDSSYFLLGDIYEVMIYNVALSDADRAAVEAYLMAKWRLTPSDPYYSNVVLLLNMGGSDGSTSFIDKSPSPKTATVVGDAVISTAQSKFGGASLLLDGNGDYLSFADSDDWTFTGDFTLEAWVRLADYPASYAGDHGSTIASQDDGSNGTSSYGWFWNIVGTGGNVTAITFLMTSEAGTRTPVTASTTMSLNTWYHLAVCRSGNTLYLFQDGVLLNAGGTAFTVTPRNSTTTLKVGALNFDVTYKYWLNGYIDDLRLTKGVARYTAAFTPPAAVLNP